MPANLKDIQRRIRSVEKTQQITSAMRMVAAAKLRRAQDAIIAARPYSDRLFATLGELGRRQTEAHHPLLEVHDQTATAEVVVVTSDRGLCGAFNNNVLKLADQVIRDLRGDFARVLVTPVGRKADEYHRRRRPDDMPRSWTGYAGVDYAQAMEIAEHLSMRYVEGDIDHVVVVASEFISAVNQTPRSFTLLPFGAGDEELHARTRHEEGREETADEEMPFEIEPDPASLLSVLVPQALEFTVYRVLLENQAGEHAARMAAMEAATRNTEELIKSLTLQFNRARQAAITTELVEIVSGAEAL